MRKHRNQRSWSIGDLPSRKGWGVVIVPLFMGLLLWSACEKEELDDNGGGGGKQAFERRAMLKNYGENLIVPSYEELDASLSEMEDAASALVAGADNGKLQTLQERFIESYEDWQRVSCFEFGPAMDEALRTFSNTFPTDTSAIEDNIASGNYDLSAFDTESEKGFPALDYLLFDPHNGDSKVLERFSSAPNASERKDYLMAVVNDLRGRVQKVLEQWRPSGGDHLSTFVNATGTDVGSSLGLLVNQLNYDLEIVKNAEIGIPLGKKSLGNPKPKNCQAYYSARSLRLAEAHLEALRDIYLGKGNEDGLGIDENLQYIGARSSNGPLAEAVREQFSVTIARIQEVPSPLSESVENASSAVDEAHAEIKKLVALLKSDMPSELGVQITYQDNDGD